MKFTIFKSKGNYSVRLQLSIQSAKFTKNQQLHTRQDPCDEKTTSSMLYKKSGQQSNIWLTYSMVYLPCFTEELYYLWYSINEDAHGWIAFSPEDFTGNIDVVISLFPMLITDI